MRIDEEGQPLDGRRGRPAHVPGRGGARTRFLDLAYIEPELREDRGEIEAAREGRLPTLITRADLRGDLHTHSDWSDGVHPIEVMAEACRRLGYAYQVLTDHSQSLAIAHGLDPERVEQERAIIAALNARFAAEEARGRARRRAPTRAASGCSTAASSRSAPTASSTTRTTSSPGSTSSSRRSTSPAASRAPSSPGGRSTRSAARTSTSSPTRRAG